MRRRAEEACRWLACLDSLHESWSCSLSLWESNNILGASTTCSFAGTVPITFSLFSLPSPSGRGLGEGLTLEAFSYLKFKCSIHVLSPHPRPFSQREKGDKSSECVA